MTITNEQAIFFIDNIVNFCTIKNIPVKIESADLRDLYNTYN